MTTEPKQLFVNLFEMACVSHITHGLWPLPGNNRERFADLDYWLELAQLLEHGGFDGIFLRIVDRYGADLFSQMQAIGVAIHDHHLTCALDNGGIGGEETDRP